MPPCLESEHAKFWIVLNFGALSSFQLSALKTHIEPFNRDSSWNPNTNQPKMNRQRLYPTLRSSAPSIAVLWTTRPCWRSLPAAWPEASVELAFGQQKNRIQKVNKHMTNGSIYIHLYRMYLIVPYSFFSKASWSQCIAYLRYWYNYFCWVSDGKRRRFWANRFFHMSSISWSLSKGGPTPPLIFCRFPPIIDKQKKMFKRYGIKSFILEINPWV